MPTANLVHCVLYGTERSVISGPQTRINVKFRLQKDRLQLMTFPISLGIGDILRGYWNWSSIRFNCGVIKRVRYFHFKTVSYKFDCNVISVIQLMISQLEVSDLGIISKKKSYL
jgi:hypothetical protein